MKYKRGVFRQMQQGVYQVRYRAHETLSEYANATIGSRFTAGLVWVSEACEDLITDVDRARFVIEALTLHVQGRMTCGHERCQRELDREIESAMSVSTAWPLDPNRLGSQRLLIITNPERTDTGLTLDSETDGRIPPAPVRAGGILLARA